ncbi:hypothetical protein E0500_005865 [Streptomyces sp. KM273126]|uniref:hypothetical protein n=1 Tax=Streptomyces sp. KM273126 TaxID=2545247 RepID=UPI0010393D29|nr:hypothetical protein [Streptomyces sp. KM273126]MBA2806982.1 hypothetical protein [Streptomyces sp. KM273126]
MTRESELSEAYEAFMALPYPDYPQTEVLRDWNSRLLTLDGWIAGYASRVEGGSMEADAVPGVDDLISQVDSLRRDLDSFGSQVAAEGPLLEEYRSYVAALHRLITEIGILASTAGN